MAKKSKQNNGDTDLTDTFLGQSFKNEMTNSLTSSLSGKQTDLNDKKSESSHYSSISSDQGQDHDLLSRSSLYKEQLNDPEILPLQVMTCCQGHYFIRNSLMILKLCLCLKGLLMKKKQIKF